jgi:hypothetical protein
VTAVKVYDVRAVVVAYVDTLRSPYPHEDFRAFRKKRLAALEAAYGIRMNSEGAQASGAAPLWMLFGAVADSFLGLRGPRAGFLDDSLINTTLDRVDTELLRLRETEALLQSHLSASREAHLRLLESLFCMLWGAIEQPVTSADLRARGFDDASEPQLHDYYDYM